MKSVIEPLAGLAVYQEIQEHLSKEYGIVSVGGCLDSQRVQFMYALSRSFPRQLLLAENDSKAKELYEDYKLYEPDVLYYPSKDLLFYQADIRGNLLLRQRMQVIRALLAHKKTTVVAGIEACMDAIASLEDMRRRCIKLTVGAELRLDLFAGQLVEIGYERVHQIELPGQFAVRGGILDVYSLTEDVPWRLELWGDEIESIRTFDMESQRSHDEVDKIHIYPATDESSAKQGVSFLSYFAPDQTLLLLNEPELMEQQAFQVYSEYQNSIKIREDSAKAPALFLYDFPALQDMFQQYHCLAACTLGTLKKEWKARAAYELEVQSVNPYHNSIELLVKDLENRKRKNFKVLLLSASRTRGKRLAIDLQERGLNSFYTEDRDRTVAPGEVMIVYGHARQGFLYPLVQFVVIAESDIFGKEKRKKKRKTEYSGQRINEFSQLHIGDYVIHENHGLGIYKGIEKIEVEHVLKEYIKIEYQGGSNLFILATQLDSLQKYSSEKSRKPRLNKLGNQEWNKTRARVQGEIKNIARDLVELYAVRESQQGYAFSQDTVWQTEFEEMFPFEETQDQLQAIEDTKRDMESTQIMDRLICGDVGYGKTEVALRAAFKAVQDGKQVVLLAPTTILAQQHYNTFVQRLKDFPVRIDLLCRFRYPYQQKKTIEDLKKGFVDIVIGTHRVLSGDVKLKDLGLLVIDEEQRFGVTHKEKIKQFKKNVDVLALSATPIPRTLHMSLIGIRDMSVLEEPPMDRRPIQTYVIEYEEETVKEAITRELDRGGQVYYVYNKVVDIIDVARKIEALVPEAHVAYAHGQMGERELEKAMYGFINGDIDVLVSTTIIETGLDISNVNTMIIHDSNRYGLSQLYQLRGRIGRSNRTAYAFFMYRKDMLLPEIAQKRLSAIRQFTELGSGIKIAMRDLELRGAGNLLGAEQHGHMEAIGYDLYCKMLSLAVKEAKGEETQEDFSTIIDLNIDAYLPDSYIANEYQKLNLYKRIAGIENEAEYEDMMDELMDRFGEPPKAAQNLLKIAYIKALAHVAYVTSIKQIGREIEIKLFERARLNPAQIPALVQKYRKLLQFRSETQQPYFLLKATEEREEGIKKFLTELISIREDKVEVS
ncbi:MAG: transcription-repair coupling factor [Lachnospiraceae bacterium]